MTGLQDLPGSRFKGPGVQVPGVRCQVPGSLCQVPGSRHWVPGARDWVARDHVSSFMDQVPCKNDKNFHIKIVFAVAESTNLFYVSTEIT